MSNEIENYGIFKKEHIDKLKVDIEDILGGKVNGEDEKLEVFKHISNLKIAVDGISEDGVDGINQLKSLKDLEKFDKSEFMKKLRIDEVIEKEEELWVVFLRLVIF